MEDWIQIEVQDSYGSQTITVRKKDVKMLSQKDGVLQVKIHSKLYTCTESYEEVMSNILGDVSPSQK